MATAFMLQGLHMIAVKLVTKFHASAKPEDVLPKTEKLRGPEPLSELYRTSDRRLSEKLAPTFGDRGCRMVSVTDPYGSILDFLDCNGSFFFQVAPQLSSRS
jgi:hypothetical protein